jgi:hypothetical protein
MRGQKLFFEKSVTQNANHCLFHFMPPLCEKKRLTFETDSTIIKSLHPGSLCSNSPLLFNHCRNALLLKGPHNGSSA